MSRYEVVMSVVVEAETSDEAYRQAVSGNYFDDQTLVEEDGIRILPDPVFVLTEKGEASIKEAT